MPPPWLKIEQFYCPWCRLHGPKSCKWRRFITNDEGKRSFDAPYERRKAIFSSLDHDVQMCILENRVSAFALIFENFFSLLAFSSLIICLSCYVMLCYVMLCYVMLCYVMLCYVMLCYVMLCYVMLCYVMLCYVMLC